MAHAKSSGGDRREPHHKTQHDHERVHYKGPSRQLGGYEYLDADTAEVADSKKESQPPSAPGAGGSSIRKH